MNKKRRAAAIMVILAVLTLVYVWQRPQSFEREFSSIIYSADTGEAKSTMLGFKGEIYRAFPGERKMTGTLRADGDLRYDVTLRESGGHYLGVISELTGDSGIQTTGLVTASLELDKIWVTLNDVNERYGFKEQEGNIAGPARTLEEAKQVAKEIIGSK
ncbi:hypothetical protein [Paenibacillus typhae]|uniref:Uncharacterized protein n=1 Tax=Paenibacillus typhae TaxID=1174501 RepID=A0A1G8TRT8_9BACL|nr:hypothetical protein [Paenibacillus typhae]SDJ44241.1 hypothetical protein SAMN05216192_11761 [Paenibacillus typhae]